ncbi:NAD(+) diphosphatase [Psychromicrobium xiongbiense]|uniref:NAD(+) diphosphatase n=1 Tax=Psychromicrobium xiongbiense TaxID=3051184 RepID=UPI003075D7FF
MTGSITSDNLRPQGLPWQQSVVDRGSERRAAPGFAAEALAQSNARLIVIHQGQTLIRDGHVVFFDARAWADPVPLQDEAGSAGPTVYLGRYQGPFSEESSHADAGQPGVALQPGDELFAVHSTDDAATALGAQATWRTFREVATELPAAESQLFIEALAILNWHRAHTHCPRCGAPTRVEVSGWVRRCPQDNSEHFPRTDPAIIVAVVGADDRLLLGGGASWESNRYSTLAGFVEPGESLEQAVVREIGEEVGIRIHTVDYLGSQSWPFPASLMLGFTARTDDVDATPDGVEVTRARWFTRPELQAAVSSGEVVISHRMSIARSLIEHWYGGVIHDAPEA